MRTLSLADALRAMEAEVSYVCRAHERHFGAIIAARGYDVHWLAAPPQQPTLRDSANYAAWLGVPWQQDAAETLAALEQQGADWLVVDHYGLDASWETSVKPAVGNLLVLDDLANRKHDCAILLDQGIQDTADHYEGLVEADCLKLLGPEYALLSASYADLHAVAHARQGMVEHVLIYFGGSDPADLTGRALRAVLKSNPALRQVDVVVGASYAHGLRLTEISAPYPNVAIHQNLPSLAPLMLAADLAIGGAGTTSWERLCLRLPALVVAMADNQLPNARLLNQAGVVKWIGDLASSESALKARIAPYLTGRSEDLWPRLDIVPVDGRGAARVATAVLAGPDMALCLRRATVEDEILLLEWANDPETRRNAFSSGQIAVEEHRAWFARRLADPSTCLMIFVESPSGIAVGHVRFDRTGEDWIISYMLGPQFRRRGLGRRILELALEEAAREVPSGGYVALVKVDNQASLRIFEQLGFAQVETDGVALKLRLNRSKQAPQ